MYSENYVFGNCSTKEMEIMMDNGTSLNQYGFDPISGILKAQNYIFMFLNSTSFYAFFHPKSFLS